MLNRYRGVTTNGQRYQAYATFNGFETYLGLFAEKDDAAQAYDQTRIYQAGRLCHLAALLEKTSQADCMIQSQHMSSQMEAPDHKPTVCLQELYCVIQQLAQYLCVCLHLEPNRHV